MERYGYVKGRLCETVVRCLMVYAPTNNGLLDAYIVHDGKSL